MTLADRFWAKVAKGDGCWEWQAFVGTHGYGAFGVDGKVNKAHRVSWVLAFGDIPEGKWVLHRCDNRKCVNPAHLFLGTRTDNILDMHQKGRYVNASSLVTHCPQGHEYTAENTAMQTDGSRKCRTCHRTRAVAYYHRNTERVKERLRVRRALLRHTAA